MRNVLTAAALAVLALAPVACNKSPEGGGTGKDQKFHLSTSGASTSGANEGTVPKGGTKPITVHIKRDDKFAGDPIELKAETADKGIKAEFVKSKMEAADKEATLNVKADSDAAVGVRTIKVTGTPKSGDAVTFDVKVEVVAQ